MGRKRKLSTPPAEPAAEKTPAAGVAEPAAKETPGPLVREYRIIGQIAYENRQRGGIRRESSGVCNQGYF